MTSCKLARNEPWLWQQLLTPLQTTIADQKEKNIRNSQFPYICSLWETQWLKEEKFYQLTTGGVFPLNNVRKSHSSLALMLWLARQTNTSATRLWRPDSQKGHFIIRSVAHSDKTMTNPNQRHWLLKIDDAASRQKVKFDGFDWQQIKR